MALFIFHTKSNMSLELYRLYHHFALPLPTLLFINILKKNTKYDTVILVDLHLQIYNFIPFLLENTYFLHKHYDQICNILQIYIFILFILSKGAKAFKNSAIYIQTIESQHLWKMMSNQTLRRHNSLYSDHFIFF